MESIHKSKESLSLFLIGWEGKREENNLEYFLMFSMFCLRRRFEWSGGQIEKS
jgi:hypothetical protein